MRAMVLGRLSFEKGQAPPSRFVSQFLGDIEALRAVCEAEEKDSTVKAARAAACSMGVDLLRDTAARDQKWWKWLLAVPVTTIPTLLSCTTKADLCEPNQQLREVFTCEQCGARVRGERGPETHLQQWCGQTARDVQAASRLEAKTGTQGSERFKKWPCLYCNEEFSTRSTALPMSAHHVAINHHPCPSETSRHHSRHHPYQFALIANNPKISVSESAAASTSADEYVLAATPAQFRQDRKRPKHVQGTAAETQEGPTRLLQSSLRDLWRGQAN